MISKPKAILWPLLGILISLSTLAANVNTGANKAVYFQGIGCTESEHWRLPQSRVRQNPQWVATLTTVPQTPEGGAAKFKLIQKFARDLITRPGFEGSWAYWNYRAAYAMKMYAYAEAGFLDLDRKLAANSPFKAATQSCIKVLQHKFQGVEQTSAYVMHEKDDQEFFKALDGGDLSKIYKTFKKIYEISKKSENQKRADAVLVLYAEELYKRGKFKDAIISAKVIDKRSEKYAQALLVMAWSAFREKDYAQAVGHAYSLMKSYPQSFEALEAVWLASAGLLEVCLEKEAQKTLEYYKNQVLRMDQWLKQHQSEINNNIYAFYQKNIPDPKVPYIMKREWIKNGRIVVLQNHLNSLIDERSTVKEWRSKRGVYRIDSIEKQVNALAEYYQSELAKEFQRALAVQSTQIESFIEKGQLLETDILAALGQEELKDEKHLAVTTGNKNVTFTKKAIWSRSGFQRGINDKKEEVWLDDIGNFIGDFKNACKR